MFRLTINNSPVVLKQGTSFKFTRENPLLTDFGDYTFDVTLPLRGCLQNIKAFGSLHRMEVSKASLSGREYSFHLLADELSVEGTAVVTSVTNEEVKLQLLAGRSETNFKMTDADGADLYIDELDLGTIWDSLGAWKPSSMDDCIRITKYSAWHGTDTEKLQYGSSAETDCVCFPIYSEEDDKVANDRVCNIFGLEQNAKNTIVGPKEYFWYWPLQSYQPAKPFEAGKEDTLKLQTGQAFAGQPYLCFILERVLKAIGAPLAKADNCIRTDSAKKWMADIFIANSRGTIHYAKMLPHWTVREFLRECGNFFGVYIRSNGSRSWVENRVPSSETVIKLEQVIDEYTAEIDEDEQGSDISVGNVGFAYPSVDHYGVLPDEVWEMADIVNRAAFDRASDEEKKRMLVVEDASDGIKAYFMINATGWELRPVNMCAPYIRNEESRDVQTELRIVPVRTEQWWRREAPAFVQNGPWGKQGSWLQYDAVIMATSASTRSVTEDEFVIDDYLKGEAEKSVDDRDCIEVGYRLPAKRSHYMLRDLSTNYWFECYAWDGVDGKPQSYVHDPVEITPSYLCGGRFDISKYRGNKDRNDTFAATVIEPSGVLSTKVKHCFTFLDRGIFPVDATYLIRGRKYVCEKIEFTITEKGVDPKKKAYFYEKA